MENITEVCCCFCKYCGIFCVFVCGCVCILSSLPFLSFSLSLFLLTFPPSFFPCPQQQEPEYARLHTIHFYIQSFVDLVNQTVGFVFIQLFSCFFHLHLFIHSFIHSFILFRTSSHDWSSLSSTIGGMIDLPESKNRERYVIRVGALETKFTEKPGLGLVGEKIVSFAPGNYGILLNDVLVACVKEQGGLKYVGVYWLCEMEMGGEEGGGEGVGVGTPYGKLVLNCGNARLLFYFSLF